MTPPVLVTGASGGIGGAVVTRLLADGYGIVATDLKPPATAFPATVDFIQADLLEDPENIARQLPPVLRGMVHVAGVIRTHRAAQISPRDFDAVFHANVLAPLRLFAALHHRLEDGASVVFIGSLAGLRASSNNLLYGASKAAIHNAARSLAKEFASRHIRINVVAPGLIDTDLTTRTTRELASLAGAEADRVHSQRIDSVPLGRIGTPDDVADCVSFLMNPRAGFVTGTELLVTGGGHL